MKTDLIYDDFKKYEITDDYAYAGFERFGDSYNHRFKFDNGYGASVIKHYGSYGYAEDLFELAVLEFFSDEFWGNLTYNTPITNDVIGHLTNNEVLELLKIIMNLKEEIKC